jgi:hypothetical protein
MDLQDYPKGSQGTTAEPTMKTYHALVIVSVIPDEDHVVLRIQTKEEWPAPGSEDTELGVLMELEVGHGETEVHAGVQA